MLFAASTANAAITFELRTGNPVTNTQSMVFDSNQCPKRGPTAMYVGGMVTNTGSSAVSNVAATLSGLNTNVYFAGGQTATHSLGLLGPGESVGVFWLTGYGCSENATATPTVQISSSGGSQSILLTLTLRKAISAAAGGNVLSSTLGPGAVVGQTVQFDAAYDFGGTAGQDEYFLQPTGGQNFNARCFRLTGSEVQSSNLAAAPLGTRNRLYFVQPYAQTGNGYRITMRYSFRYLCANASTVARPYAIQTSGNTNIKYTGNFDGTGSIAVSFPGATNPFTISKSVSPVIGVTSETGPLTFTVTVSNPSPYPSLIDKIVDILPEGVSFAALSTGSSVTVDNSSSFPAAGATGSLTFLGKVGQSYAIPAGGSISLIYTANRPLNPGSYTNTAQAHIGQETTPIAQATYNHSQLQALAVTKTSVVYSDPVSGTANPFAIPGAIAEYTIGVTNPNIIAMDADSVIVSDQTPANTKLCLSGLAPPNASPVLFVEQTPASTLTYVFVSLGNAGDSLEFSSNGGSDWAHVPVLDGDGCDGAITHFRVRPIGTFAPGGRFSLLARYRVD
ncbi:MAG: hypothetical protein Q8R44_15720 [Novosphingobium sp.]|nr:hypothetical protein [Novosphingobium sp.]